MKTKIFKTTSKKALAWILSLIMLMTTLNGSFFAVSAGLDTKAELNLLPTTDEEVANQSKIFIPETGAINVTLNNDGSVELFSPANWPSFYFPSAEGFVPDSVPLYLYYDFTLYGEGGSNEMKLDIHVNDDMGNGPVNNIFENYTGATTKINEEAYIGVLNLTDLYGKDVEIINAIAGIISGVNMKLTFRELKLSTIPPKEYNLLPTTQAQVTGQSKIRIPSAGSIGVTLNNDGSVELFSSSGWPSFYFPSAEGFVPDGAPLYLYYDFTLYGEGGSNEMRLDIHVNDDLSNEPSKNVFEKYQDTTTKVRPEAYKGVINLSELYGENVDIINSIVGIISGENMKLTFRELRLSTTAPEPVVVVPKKELKLLPTTQQEVTEQSKIMIPDFGTISVALNSDGSVVLNSPTSWPSFYFPSAEGFVPDGAPLYLYYDFTLYGEGGSKEMRLDIHVNDDLSNEPSKNVFEKYQDTTTKVRSEAYKGVINLSELYGEDVEKINFIVGIISGENMKLTFRELRLSTTEPEPVVVVPKKELNLLPTTQQEVTEQSKILIPDADTISVALNSDGSVVLNSPTSWPTFRFPSAEGFVPDGAPLYLYYDFTLYGEGGSNEMRLDIHVNDDLSNEPSKNVFEKYQDTTTKVRPEAYKGVINLSELYGEDVAIINSIVGIISGENMKLTFRELRLSTTAPEPVVVVPKKELNLLPTTQQEVTEQSKIMIPDFGTISVALNSDGSVVLNSPTSWPTFRFPSAEGFVPDGAPLYLYYDFTLTGGGGSKEMRLDIHVNDADEDYNVPAKNVFEKNSPATTPARPTAYKGVINLTELFGKDISKINSIVGIISGENMKLTFRELRLSTTAPKEDQIPKAPKELNLLPTTQQEVADGTKIHVFEAGAIDVVLKNDGAVELYSARNFPNFQFLAALNFEPNGSPLYLYYDFTLMGKGGAGEMRLDIHANDTDEYYDTPSKNIFKNNTDETTKVRAAAYKGVIDVTAVFGNDIEKINSIVGIISGDDIKLTLRELKLSTIKPDGPLDSFDTAGGEMTRDTFNLLPTTQQDVDQQLKISSSVIGGPLENGELITVTLNDDNSVTVYNAINWPTFLFEGAKGLTFKKSPLYLYYDFTLSMGAEMRFDVHVNEDKNIYDAAKNVLERGQNTTTVGKPNAYKGAVNLTELFGDVELMNAICCIISGTDATVTFRQFELSYITPEVVKSNDRTNTIKVDPILPKEPETPNAVPVSSRVLLYVFGGIGAIIVVAGGVVGGSVLVRKFRKKAKINK